MALRLSNRLVDPDTPRKPPCPVRARLLEEQEVRIDLAACCPHRIELCIDQHTDKVFTFTDAAGADYTDAAEITFKVWNNENGNDPVLIVKSLTGGGVLLIGASAFRTAINNTESGAFSPGARYYEAAITNSSGDQYVVALGPLIVRDTRSFD